MVSGEAALARVGKEVREKGAVGFGDPQESYVSELRRSRKTYTGRS